METTKTHSKIDGEAEHVPAVLQSSDALDHEIHQPQGWFNWRLFAYSEHFYSGLILV